MPRNVGWPWHNFESATMKRPRVSRFVLSSCLAPLVRSLTECCHRRSATSHAGCRPARVRSVVSSDPSLELTRLHGHPIYWRRGCPTITKRAPIREIEAKRVGASKGKRDCYFEHYSAAGVKGRRLKRTILSRCLEKRLGQVARTGCVMCAEPNQASKSGDRPSTAYQVLFNFSPPLGYGPVARTGAAEAYNVLGQGVRTLVAECQAARS